MERNLEVIDRLIRLVLASILFYLGLFLYGSSGVGIALVVAGVVLLLSALLGFCGLYRLLGIRTNSVKSLS